MISPKVLLAAGAFVGSVFSAQGVTTWIADADFVANELPNLPDPSSTELSNPNGKVPQWSYGARDTVTSTAFTFFTPASHTNSLGGNPGLQGYQSGILTTIANVTNAEISGLGAGQLLVHPLQASDSLTYNVIRWTAPAAGIYSIDSSWNAVATASLPTDDGIDAHIVLNGVPIFNALVGPTQTRTDSRVLALAPGDILDFVTGPGAAGQFTNDSTIFNTVISVVPEPASALLAAMAVPVLLRRRRRA